MSQRQRIGWFIMKFLTVSVPTIQTLFIAGSERLSIFELGFALIFFAFCELILFPFKKTDIYDKK